MKLKAIKKPVPMVKSKIPITSRPSKPVHVVTMGGFDKQKDESSVAGENLSSMKKRSVETMKPV